MVWYARRDYIQKNPAQVTAFRDAIEDATRWVKDPANRAAVFELTMKNLKAADVENKDELMRRLVEDELEQYDTTLVKSSIEGMNKFLVENKLIDKPLDIDAIIAAPARP